MGIRFNNTLPRLIHWVLLLLIAHPDLVIENGSEERGVIPAPSSRQVRAVNVDLYSCRQALSIRLIKMYFIIFHGLVNTCRVQHLLSFTKSFHAF